MNELDDTLMAYLAKKVVQDFRNGIDPEERLCIALNHRGPADHLRKTIKEADQADAKGDADWIARLLRSSFVYHRRLGMDLTKPIAKEAQIREALLDMWKKERDEPIIQSLIFALLNIDDLSQEMHQALFDWVRAHKPEFIASVSEWYGGRQNIVITVKERVLRNAQNATPTKKNWIYLCVALASNDRAGALKFVQSLPDDGWPFMNDVRSYATRELSEERVL